MTKSTAWLFGAAFAFAAVPLAFAAEPNAGVDDPAEIEDAGALVMPPADKFAPETASATAVPSPASIGTFLAGLGGAAADTSVLRFTNGGDGAGTISLTLYDAAAGTQLATWTSASIPAHAALQVTAPIRIAATGPTVLPGPSMASNTSEANRMVEMVMPETGLLDDPTSPAM